ncbi:MAG: CAP domain-containing protein [Deltaproteobacteria bacterium]|nr:CAP domain-containing protein [Deltaproteobacteria bacterium]
MFKIVKISLFVLTLLLGTSQQVFSEASDPSEEEVYFLFLINEARKDPLGMAEYLGLDREAILQDLPQLKEILTAGVPPLKFDPKLYKAAVGHTAEMLKENYYAHDALDGRTYGERIRESGYLAVVNGESLGMLSFQNFIAPEEAVEAIFKSIFLDELDPATQAERNILNPEITEAGIALGSGPFNMNGFSLNAYLTTLDFGKPVVDTEAVEAILVGMLNVARSDPGLAFLGAGIDAERAAKAYGDLASALTRSLAPLAWNNELHGAASAHNRDMHEQGYFDTVSLDGLTAFDRVATTGYDAVCVGESLDEVFIALGGEQSLDAFDVAYKLYESILHKDTNPEFNSERNIFHPFVTEIGISVETSSRVPDGGDEQLIGIVLVADFAEPLEQRYFLMGTVYEDHNKNGVVDKNEAIQGITIRLSPGEGAVGPEIVTQSGPTGRYQIDVSQLPTNFMEMYVDWQGDAIGPFGLIVAPIRKNLLRNLRITESKKKWGIYY